MKEAANEAAPKCYFLNAANRVATCGYCPNRPSDPCSILAGHVCHSNQFCCPG